MADTTTSTLDNLLSTYFVRDALPRLQKKAILHEWADKTALPKGEGTTVVWNAWSNFSPVTGNLTEATNPTAGAVSSRKVSATVLQYGRVIKLSDLAEATISLDPLKGIVENLSDSAGLSVDRVIQKAIFKNSIARNVDNTILSAWMSAVVSAFHAGTNTTNSGQSWGFPVRFGTSCSRLSAVNKAAPTVSCRLSMYSIKSCVKALRNNNAMEYADGNYKALTNTDAVADLRTDPDFKEWFKYTDHTSAMSGLGGQGTKPVFAGVEGATLYASNNIPKYRATAHNADITFIWGKGAYGAVGFNTSGKKGFEIIIKRPGPQDTSNTLNMFGTLGYKFTMVGAALNVSSGRILITTPRP